MATVDPDLYVKGEGGAIFGFTTPLPREIQKRLDANELQRVNADGSEYVEPEAEPAPEADEVEPEAEPLAKKAPARKSKAEGK